jgi:integrase/recombinase XerD
VKIEDAIALYCDECKHRHLSERSVAGNRGYLLRFAEFLQGAALADVRDATLQTLLDFHRWMQRRKKPDGEPVGVRYVNRHARLARHLFKLLAERNLILSDIGRDFPPLHDPQSLPRGILTKEQMAVLLRQPHQTTPLGFRDRTILELLYSTGLRGGELCKLTLYDLDLEDRTLRVIQGKGRKDRVAPIGKVACTYLAEYIRAVRPVLVAEASPPAVFLSATGRPLLTNDLHRLIKTYREKAHLPDNVTTHSLRHTCATEMLKGGASIRHVQELLGHADIQTTQIYTHVVPTDLQKAHARTAPSERRQAVAVPRFDTAAPSWNDPRNARFWRERNGPAAKKARNKRRKRA